MSEGQAGGGDMVQFGVCSVVCLSVYLSAVIELRFLCVVGTLP